jgi:hypothetical protein
MVCRSYCLIFLCLTLFACGGDGSQTVAPLRSVTPAYNTLPVKISENGINLYFPDNFYVNQAAGIAVTGDNAQGLTNVSWQQIAGPELSILASHSQVIGFDIPSAGTYTLALEVTTTAGQTSTHTLSFSAGESAQQTASVRLDHAVTERGKVSLRVDQTKADSRVLSRVDWQQIAGPTVQDLNPQNHLLFFNAPSVSRDSVLAFSAKLVFEDGSEATDSAMIVVKNTNIDNNGYFPSAAGRVVTTDAFAYIPTGQYANVLVDCVYSNTLSSSCNFATLPLIGQQHRQVTIDDVMARLVVSHPWMGQRFREFLQESASADDMLTLLGATTAIVIAYDIRPSFYWSATGAIYLDAANFWRTAQERDTLNDQPDYRSDFGNALQFSMPWRYIKNNQYYIRNGDYPAAARLSKPFSALEANVSWLMYHELGHANDFFPVWQWPTIPSNTTPLAFSAENEPSSTVFSQRFPLASSEMQKLAQVSFAGQGATEQQKALQATDVQALFEPDQAPDYYCYSTVREDFATLFGHFMMAYRLGVSADVAILSSIDNPQLLVTWGQRNRINALEIQTRVQSAVEAIFPQLDVAQIQRTLPPPQLMQAGRDWFSNVVLDDPATPSGLNQKPSPLKPLNEEDYWQVFSTAPEISHLH